MSHHLEYCAPARDLVLDLIVKHGLKHSAIPFSLKSGGLSNWYLDLKTVMMNPDAYPLVGTLLVRYLDPNTTHVTGMATGAIPLVCAALAEASRLRRLSGSYLRSEERGHGTQTQQVGSPELNDRITVLEDVTTTGASVMKVVEHFGGVHVIDGVKYSRIVQVLTVVDRSEGKANLQFTELGIPFRSIYTLDEVIVNAKTN